jgi:hypothetical protein
VEHRAAEPLEGGWAWRARFTVVTSGASVSGRDQSAVLISYFSDARYSSLASLCGSFSHSS